MKQSILELAIIVDSWKQILDVWPEANLKECTFPFEVHYIVEELNNQSRIYLYLFELENTNHLETMEKLIPLLPFCVMFAEEINDDFLKKVSDFTNRFETPLFLVLLDDEHLKEKISILAQLESKLPEFVVLENMGSVSSSVRKLVKTILDKINPEKLVNKTEATEQAVNS